MDCLKITYSNKYGASEQSPIFHLPHVGEQSSASKKGLNERYYILDATGQVISTYERVIEGATVKYHQTEKYIYGSTMLGVMNDSLPLYGSQNNTYSQTTWTHTIGKRNYNLTNHLGSVLSVVSDKVIPHDGGSGVVDYFLADILQSQDYSAYGVILSSRSFTKTSVYRKSKRGYQGSEMDNEMKGDGNSYTTEYRLLDTRLGRWLTIDPKLDPGMSPYNSMDDNPIRFSDPYGLYTKGRAERMANRARERGCTASIYKAQDSRKWVVDVSYQYNGETFSGSFSKGDQIKDDVFKSLYWEKGYSTKIEMSDFALAENSSQSEMNLHQYKNSLKNEESYWRHKNWTFDVTNPYYKEMQARRRNIDKLGSYMMNSLAVLVCLPAAIEGAAVIQSSPALQPIFGVSTKYWAAKTGISATMQALTNNGNVNVFGAFCDGFLGYGSSSILGSGINAQVNVLSGDMSFQTLGYGIDMNQYLFQVAVGFTLGAKGDLVTGGFNRAYGSGRPSDARQIGKMIYNSVVYSPATNSLNRAYEEYNK